MRKTALIAGILAALCLARVGVAQELAQPVEAPAPAPRPHIAYLDKSKTIYVAEFETSAEIAPSIQAKDGAIDGRSMGAPKLNGTDAAPAGDSRHVATLMAESLLHEIKKAGYKPKMLAPGDALPDDGILFSGVFTEPGKDGQLRRAGVGQNAPAGDLQLYVTTSNLLRLAKPLYEVVKPTAGGLGGGGAGAPAIKLNAEVATLKFSVTSNPADKAVKKIAEQIVAELQRLTLQAQSEGLAGGDDPLNKFSKP